MKVIVIAALLLSAVQALAGPEPISGSESPDKRYRVSIEQINEWINYRIDAVQNNKALLRIASSYQPDLGSEEWVHEKSRGFTVHWRDDSRVVAIEEANYRGMGTVLFACRTKDGFSLLSIDEKSLIRATHKSWNAGRLFFVGWGKKESVILNLVGRIYAEDQHSIELSEWQFEIDLSDDGKVLQQKKVSPK